MAEVCLRGKWVCQADFSIGDEENCRWKVSKDIASKLLTEWKKLKTTFEAPAEKSVFLGYKGTRLIGSGNIEFYSHGETVTLKKGNIIETKQDRRRRFEKIMLSTAPKGIIPQALYMFEFE
ncbi:MAG: hypothetical protein ACP5P3_10580 [Ignavibacteria bacterium]